MRAGFNHMLQNRDAHKNLFVNIVLHAVVQASTTCALGGGSFAALPDVLKGLLVYWVVVCAVDRACGCGRPYPVPEKAGWILAAAVGILHVMHR